MLVSIRNGKPDASLCWHAALWTVDIVSKGPTMLFRCTLLSSQGSPSTDGGMGDLPYDALISAVCSNILRLGALGFMYSKPRHVRCFHALDAETLKRVRVGAETGQHAISLSHVDVTRWVNAITYHGSVLAKVVTPAERPRMPSIPRTNVRSMGSAHVFQALLHGVPVYSKMLLLHRPLSLLMSFVLRLFAGAIREQGQRLLQFFHYYLSAGHSSVSRAGCIEPPHLLARFRIRCSLLPQRGRMAPFALQYRDNRASRRVIDVRAVSVCSDSCSCPESVCVGLERDLCGVGILFVALVSSSRRQSPSLHTLCHLAMLFSIAYMFMFAAFRRS